MMFIYVLFCINVLRTFLRVSFVHTHMHISISYNLSIYIDLIVWSCSELQGKSLIAFSKLFLKIFLNCYCLLTLKYDICLRQFLIYIVLSRDFDFQPHSSPMYKLQWTPCVFYLKISETCTSYNKICITHFVYKTIYVMFSIHISNSTFI